MNTTYIKERIYRELNTTKINIHNINKFQFQNFDNEMSAFDSLFKAISKEINLHINSQTSQIEELHIIFARLIQLTRKTEQLAQTSSSERDDRYKQVQIESALRIAGDLLSSLTLIRLHRFFSSNATDIHMPTGNIGDALAIIAESKQQVAAAAELTKKYDEKITQIGLLEIDLARDQGELNRNKNLLEDLMKRYHDARPSLDKTLAKWNQKGLAGAFQTKEDELKKTKLIWGFAFAMCLCIISYGAFHFATQQAPENAYTIIQRAFIGLPLIWGAWFSAKQFSFSAKLQENYSFKVASAIAFNGYKEAAEKINNDLLEKLTLAAINNFSENPSRIYGNPSDASSPFEDLIKSVGENEKAIELLSRLFVSKK